MKQSFKYGLLLLLLLLLHSRIMDASKEVVAFVSIPQYKCYISQDRPIHRAIERFYHFYSHQLCDLASVADLSSSNSTDKGSLLPTGYYKEAKSYLYHISNSPPLYKAYISHPATYYIYSLRKIII